jgi:hypothetical protein
MACKAALLAALSWNVIENSPPTIHRSGACLKAHFSSVNQAMWPPTYTAITTGLQKVRPESAGSGFDVHSADALPRLSRSLHPQWIGCLICGREASLGFARHKEAGAMPGRRDVAADPMGAFGRPHAGPWELAMAH